MHTTQSHLPSPTDYQIFYYVYCTVVILGRQSIKLIQFSGILLKKCFVGHELLTCHPVYAKGNQNLAFESKAGQLCLRKIHFIPTMTMTFCEFSERKVLAHNHVLLYLNTCG